MKDYIIEVKDGQHHVRMLTDEEMKFKAAAESVVRFCQNVYDAVEEAVENIVESLRHWIEENNIIELLEEYENDKHSTGQGGRILPISTAGEAGHCDAGAAGD